MPLLQHLPTPERESLSRYGSDSQIRKDWKAILAKAESDLAAAEQATRTLQAETWDQAARELSTGSLWIRTSGNVERHDAIDECARMLSNLANQYAARAAALRQSPPPTETK
jgi:hypothetical protein